MTATAHDCAHLKIAGCDHDDVITQAALEAEKTLPPKVVPRSGPLTVAAVALLDVDGNIIMSQPLNIPVVPVGGALTLQDMTFVIY